MNEGTSLPTMTQLKERGWTAALVKKFLDPPDDTRPNPHDKSASAMRLSTVSRVEAAEKCADWKTASNRARARSEVGKAVAARKAAEQVKAAEHLPITVTHLPLDQLRSRAIASYNLFHEEVLWERGHDYERASEQSDPLEKERITVNDIRHHLTEYETHLEEVAGQVGVSEAGRVIRRRVYAQIAAHYPEYAEECRRQIQARSIEADYAIS